MVIGIHVVQLWWNLHTSELFCLSGGCLSPSDAKILFLCPSWDISSTWKEWRVHSCHYIGICNIRIFKRWQKLTFTISILHIMTTFYGSANWKQMQTTIWKEEGFGKQWENTILKDPEEEAFVKKEREKKKTLVTRTFPYSKNASFPFPQTFPFLLY